MNFAIWLRLVDKLELAVGYVGVGEYSYRFVWFFLIYLVRNFIAKYNNVFTITRKKLRNSVPRNSTSICFSASTFVIPALNFLGNYAL